MYINIGELYFVLSGKLKLMYKPCCAGRQWS